MVDGTGTTTYNYGAVNTLGGLRVSSIVGPYTNDTLGITYDLDGRLAGETISGGNETFGYDAINRLNSHVTPLGTFTNTYLGETDQISSRSVTNGSITTSTSWGYDTNVNDRRLISITNSGVTRSYTLGYGTSPVNPYDIMSITDTAATGHPFATQSHAYTYDKADRLLTGTSTTPGNFTYAYDDVDNATTWTTPSGTKNPTYNPLNQISTWGTLTYNYDNNGNLLNGDGAKTYKWDAENRLIEIDYTAGGKSQFTYNGIGQRRVDTETASGGGVTTTRNLWCGAFICQTRSGTDVVQRRQMAEGELNVTTSQKLVYMPDQLGATRDVIDATTGTRVQSYDYEPYGAITRTNGTTPTDYQYASLFSHPQSTLNLSATRAYDPATGRWLNKDPIREVGGINLYSYSGVNPINAIDPTGLTPFGRIFGGWLGRLFGGALGGVVDPVGGEVPGGVIGGKIGGDVGDALTNPEPTPPAGDPAQGAGDKANSPTQPSTGASAEEPCPHINAKIENDMKARGWTPSMIKRAQQTGKQIKAINKANGNPATRYIDPVTGQSVVIDNITNDVIHVGGPGFSYGPNSGDLP